MKTVIAHMKTTESGSVERLKELLRIPSVSGDPAKAEDVVAAAQVVRRRLLEAGLSDARLVMGAGRPIVVATRMVDPALPTMLFYGHVDVQPADGDGWHTPPFEPTVREGVIYGRGASDDKGQVQAFLDTLRAYYETDTPLPVNVKIFIETEEEVGGNVAADYLRDHAKDLAADLVLVCDTHMTSVTQPLLIVGLRGLCYFEIDVTTSDRDLHSGAFGGGVDNAIQVLADLLSGCKDRATGRVTIDGFYTDVRNFPADATFSDPTSDADFVTTTGAKALYGEQGYSTAERIGARPTFEVHGIWGGYAGDGPKTVIPGQAHAKVSMRLVTGQHPERVAELFADHVRRNTPHTADITVRHYPCAASAARTSTDSPALRAAASALTEVYGTRPDVSLEGGTIPIVAECQRHLGADIVLMGFGLPDDNIHGVNEKFDLEQYARAKQTIARFMLCVAECYKDPSSAESAVT